jgi:hypothetical protein
MVSNVAILPGIEIGEVPLAGNINIDMEDRTVAAGCDVLRFTKFRDYRTGEPCNLTAEEQFRTWAAETKGRTAVLKLYPDNGDLVILYAFLTSEEEKEVMTLAHQHFTQVWWPAEKEKWKAANEKEKEARTKAEAEASSRAKERLAELEKYAEIGRRCEHNHSKKGKK